MIKSLLLLISFVLIVISIIIYILARIQLKKGNIKTYGKLIVTIFYILFIALLVATLTKIGGI